MTSQLKVIFGTGCALQDANKRHHPLDLNTLKGHGDIVTGVCFSPNAQSLATGNFGLRICLFEL